MTALAQFVSAWGFLQEDANDFRKLSFVSPEHEQHCLAIPRMRVWHDGFALLYLNFTIGSLGPILEAMR